MLLGTVGNPSQTDRLQYDEANDPRQIITLLIRRWTAARGAGRGPSFRTPKNLPFRGRQRRWDGHIRAIK